MNQTTQKSQHLSETCPKCEAPIELETYPLGAEATMTIRVHTCDCRDKEIAKLEEEKKAKERWDVFKHRQKDLDELVNEYYSGGKDWEITFDKLIRTFEKQIIAVEKYIENLETNLRDGKSFGLLGHTGTGKTGLIICLHKELIKRGITSAIVNVPSFFKEIDAKSFNKEVDIKKIMKAKVLTFDDLFRVGYSVDKRELIHRILDYRYQRCLPTFFTSNIYGKNKEEVKKLMLASLRGKESDPASISEAIYDRLRNERVVLITFVGESFRQGGMR